jgi:PKD repeat protein
MARRSWILALAIGALLVTTQSGFVRADGPPPLPSSMAAVGDSISQAVSSGGSLGATYPQNSWSTGTNTSVDSHYQRLLALSTAISGHAYNHSVSGADMADLNGQMAGVVSLQPDYLTVLIGGNDLCTDTVAQMTPVTTFGAEFQTAMDTLTQGSPDSLVYVASIPNVYQLWQLFHNNWWARFIWSVGGICQSLLANPTSTNATDVARRAAVAQRNVEYNTALANVCLLHPNCRFDDNAVYNVVFSSSDVAGDYFHPSVSGQAKLAAVTWAAGYWPNGGPVTDNPPTAAFTSSCTDLSCTFDASGSSDDHGIASYGWTFGDTLTGAGETPSHTYAGDGTYPVTLTVTDTAGQTSSVSHDVTVTAPTQSRTMHIASLVAGSADRKGGWTATVTVSIADAASNAVSGATVSGTWSSGGSAGCTTDASGSCTFTTNMNKKTKMATYQVTDVTANGFVWDGVASSVTVP